MIRRFGDARVDGQHYTRRHGAYAIVLQGDHVLLTHQSWPENDWQLPGGGIDANESAAQALRREVREETGWRVRPLRRLGAFRRFCYMPDYDLWAEKLCSIYLAQPLRAVGPPTEPGHRAAWRPLPEAVALLGNDGDRSFLVALLR
ncbi:NUDIX hydrolase [Roseibaca sp. V10]|uniref:NUDIX hydrolase n=1 Tax=Roseinatronobacter domitianus TaxID=2940293 RepID=A0ABT0M412_9RHOB|nr:NUDIX hydrolase [Roseibaca domitiana]MCL1629589.1 NUDIX hydrolase [Roseibaca domitiana]